MAIASGNYTSEDIEKCIELIKTIYSDYGIALPEQSYIKKYMNSAHALHQALQNGDDEIVKDRSKFLSAIEGQLECIRLAGVLSAARNKIGLKPICRKMLEGYIDPTMRRRTKAKDALFELEILELLDKAGLDARLEEPDIIFRLDGEDLAVACKCIYSINNLENQIRKARKQIIGSKRKGLIALDISAVVNHNCIINVNDEEEFGTNIDSISHAFVNTHMQDFHRWINSGQVIGIILKVSTLASLYSKRSFITAQKIIFANYRPLSGNEHSLL